MLGKKMIKEKVITSLVAVSFLSVLVPFKAFATPVMIANPTQPIPDVTYFNGAGAPPADYSPLTTVGNLTNATGLYGFAGIATKVEHGVGSNDGGGLSKEINYSSVADLFTLDIDSDFFLAMIVKEGHPEYANPPAHGQSEDFHIWAVSTSGYFEQELGKYVDLDTTNDDGYWFESFEGSLKAGTYYLSFRAGFEEGSVEYLSQFSTKAPVPEPSTFALFGLGAISMAFIRRRKSRD